MKGTTMDYEVVNEAAASLIASKVLDSLAKIMWEGFAALIEQGFSREEAMRVLLSDKFQIKTSE
jgi:hypothetical protein